MNTIHFETFLFLLLLFLSMDYFFKYYNKLLKNVYIWLLYTFSIVLLSLLNIGIYINTIASDYTLVLGWYALTFLPVACLVYYIKINYLATEEREYSISKSLFIQYLVYIVVLVMVFTFDFRYNLAVDHITEVMTYKLLFIPMALPLGMLFISAFKKKKNINYKVVLAIALPLIGMVLDANLRDSCYLTAAYTLSVLVLYMMKHDQVINEDVLTGLYNRRFFDNLTFNKSQLMAFYLIDVDKFKNINDTYGHDVGDMVLRDVADILNDSARATDYVIRFGGDEFLIVAKLKQRDHVTIIPNRINKLIAKYNKTKDIQISVSLGYEFYSSEIDNFAEIFKILDKKMYDDKQSKCKKSIKN